jgi:hypothetical protein
MGEDDIKAVCDMLPKAGAMDAEETDEEKAAREKKEAEAKTAKDAEMKDMVTKPAMDAAIQTAVTAATKTVRETERGIRAALAEVHPWTGDIPASMAFDSAADVRRHALKMLKVDGAEALHADALLPVLMAQPKPGARAPKNDGHVLAMDASVMDKATKLAPGLANIENA